MDQVIEDGVQLLVDGLVFRMSLEPGQGTPQTFRPVHFTGEIGYEALDLAVVKYHTVGFISDQTSISIRPVLGDQIGWNMNDVWRNPQSPVRFEIDLIPGKNLVGCDLK